MGAHMIAVATQAGYLHGLSEDGALKWSYSIEGGLLSGVQAWGDARLVGASSSRKLYAWGFDGQLQWLYNSQVNPSWVAVAGDRGLGFFASGPYVYAITAHGALSWRAELGATVRGPMLTDREGAAWLITDDGKLHRLETPYFHKSWALREEAVKSDAEARLLAVGSVEQGATGALIQKGESLSWLEPKSGSGWTLNGVQAAALSEPRASETQSNVPSSVVVVLLSNGDIEWLSLASGTPIASVHASQLGLNAESQVNLAGHDTRAFIADGAGRVWVWNQRGKWARCQISYAPALQPVFDSRRQILVAGAGDGTVMGLGFVGDWQ